MNAIPAQEIKRRGIAAVDDLIAKAIAPCHQEQPATVRGAFRGALSGVDRGGAGGLLHQGPRIAGGYQGGKGQTRLG